MQNNRANITSAMIASGTKNIDWFAYNGYTNLCDILIPASITDIGGWAFDSCGALTKVFYGGMSAVKWNSISIESGNEPLINATRYYYSPVRPETKNTHWYFGADGRPAVWQEDDGSLVRRVKKNLRKI